MKALVLAERSDAARELAAGARTMADEVVLVAIGGLEVADGTADKIIRIALPADAVYDDAYATVISVFDAEQPAVILAEPTRHVKSVVGRVAAHANTSVITDVMSFEGVGARSLYFGGVAERVQKAAGDVAVYTVGAGAFEGAEASGANAVEEVAWVAPASAVRLVSSKPRALSGVDLNKADVVVAAGRGFAEEPELDLARALCDKLGAGLACSRPLTEGVDWLPSELYVGVSGLMLSPKVYVACGISGQMQHMVGCNRAGTMFAINKDKNAPVFKQCDYGLVGDVKDVLPALAAAL
ncbi:electron transfer flavoprotein subunit alpha/FixB family protein [Gordonibacter urolithinfaciens]|uniref:Electron transfer flavoprotein subunit alpha/FixB family protein n=1 Tax=Gordonibacter urolithinfaciens TaxID=1335613 RepID=A0A6N8IJM2_9ACTN|nr:electron transfer flavoprotein subunit alpha/FixB family protein [Gordonibacter urolithinfaciens]MVM55946.1 electron transfer flavoprotein subunit alpha/FixB family protein [Gordonibacter urolithinfaciens]MVN16094.1 electron transfer flavoprotein subunit alpha/FixB family protein [Gordonibacter urolithinfaciens]MVN39365.1 electron transfer flavoprotein subunit alpha/FixB family protein [Gordonibacter urolithinfaciens]MVN56421.1 electron transfer flavoprotein subunit alpha/FixB family protein